MLFDLIWNAVVAGILLLIGVLAALGVERRSPRLVVAAGSLGVALVAATGAIPWQLPLDTERILTIGIVVLAFALGYVAIFQQPAWLAKRLGFTDLSAREFEFDWKLTRLIDEFNEVLRIAKATQADGEERDALRLDVARILQGIQDLRPPTHGWAELVTIYMTLFRIHLDQFGSPLPENFERHFLELNEHATAQRETLRAGYARRGRSGRRPI
jgi:hypothetical protein